jgi:hypothetical protein
MTQKNIVKTLRIPQGLIDRVRKVAARSTLEESDLYRIAIIAGMDRIEAGEFNPFTDPDGKKPKK